MRVKPPILSAEADLSPAAQLEHGLEGARVVLRRTRVRDYPAWAALRAESREFLSAWEPSWSAQELSRAAFRRKVRRHAEDAEAGRAFAMLNWRRSDGALLGGVTLGHIRRGAAQSAVVGYWIGAAHARRGYTLEAMRLTVAFAFQALGLHRLEASCMPENTASRALLARLGFVEEGLARRSLQIAGAWRDHLSLGLLAEEWPR